tara:strand:- start:142 stop:768 length:627 start_codon:yes stop_codon:yes gene_type:complete
MIDIKEIIECSKQERDYPEIRGERYENGFDGGTHVGRVLWCLAAHPKVERVLDLFARTGSGSFLTIAHAQQHSGGDKIVYSVEREEDKFPIIEKNLEGYSTARLLKGDITTLFSFEKDKKQIREQEIDLVCCDPDPPVATWCFDFINNVCEPKVWLMHNTNPKWGWRIFYEKLIHGKKYTEVLYDKSPNMKWNRKEQEFAIFIRNDVL